MTRRAMPCHLASKGRFRTALQAATWTADARLGGNADQLSAEGYGSEFGWLPTPAPSLFFLIRDGIPSG